MTDGDKAEEAALLQEHGKQTFAKYMKVLMEGPEVFRMVAKCHESDVKENLLICCSQRHFIHLTGQFGMLSVLQIFSKQHHTAVSSNQCPSDNLFHRIAIGSDRSL